MEKVSQQIIGHFKI